MSYHDILPADLNDFCNKEKITIFDTRDPNSFAQQHLSGAIPISDELIMQLRAKKLFEQPILVYCYHGHSSKDICEFLSSLGFKQVYNVVGGWANIKMQLYP